MMPVVDTLEVEVDVSTESIYWFMCYKASDFPMMTWEKDYFFLWSTDHDQGGLNGGIWWGDGNNPDLTDFRERGLIRDGYQAETPFPYVFDNKFYLYYHTISTNPLNTCGGNGQETNLMTAESGVLHTATWTDQTNPLGCQGVVDGISQAHTGYLRFWNIKGNILGSHHFGAGSPFYFQKSATMNGQLWFHNAPYNDYNVFLENDDRWVIAWGDFFERNGQLWGIVNSADKFDNFSGGASLTGLLHLVKINEHLEITELVHTFTDTYSQGFGVSVIGDTAHLYRQTGRADEPDTFSPYLGYSQIDLKPLDYL